jgi:hypothetical protein
LKLHSVFLRKDCILPNRLDPVREPVGAHWTLVEDLAAPVFDTMIRQAGWHFMWIQDSCARMGFGSSRASATTHALTRALNGIAKQFNSAELDSVQVANYPGFHVATVTLQPRQIQQQTSLDCPNEI